MNKLLASLALAGFALLTGCSATSSVTTSSLTIPKTLQAPRLTGEPAQFYEELVKPFAERGFRVGQTTDPRAGAIELDFEPSVWNTTFTLRLVHEGRVIAMSSASNKGWGTGINRPGALRDLVVNVQTAMSDELGKININIVADKSIETACERAYSDPRLDPIRPKLNLDGQSLNRFASLTNNQNPTSKEKEAIGVWASVTQDCFQLVVKRLQDIPNGQLLIDARLDAFNTLQSIQAKLFRGDLTFGEAAAAQNQLITKLKDGSIARLEEMERGRLADESVKGKSETESTQNSWVRALPPPRAATVIPAQPVFTSCTRVGNQVFCNSY